MADSKTYEVPTSITLSYRESRWGLERIVLDGISNHLPADSKGTSASVRLLQEGQWFDLTEADPSKPTEEIRFEDDGAGYPADYLSLLFSTKGADAQSVGQFGEGLKLVAAAAIRAGENIEYRSRNWVAQPFTKELDIEGRQLHQLHFRVTENGEQITGSRTVFYKPSQQLVDAVFSLPQKILQLNPNYTELYNGRYGIYGISNSIIKLKNKQHTTLPNKIDLSKFAEFVAKNSYDIGSFSKESSHEFDDFYGAEKSSKYPSRIIDLHTDETALFVKGVRIQKRNSIFSYDLGLENITPDRIYGDEKEILGTINRLLYNCTSIEVIDTILRRTHDTPGIGFDECDAFGSARQFAESIQSERKRSRSIDESSSEKSVRYSLWADRFKAIYGENAVLSGQTVFDNDAKIMGYTPVRLHENVMWHLKNNGVPNSEDIASMMKQEYRWISLDDLTDQEREVLSYSPQIIETALGTTVPVDVRVYSGLFTESGREIPTNLGVHVRNPDGSSFIGVKRSQLDTPWMYANTLIHETGHQTTGAGDFDRKFAGLFIDRLTDMTLDKLGVSYERPQFTPEHK